MQTNWWHLLMPHASCVEAINLMLALELVQYAAISLSRWHQVRFEQSKLTDTKIEPCRTRPYRIVHHSGTHRGAHFLTNAGHPITPMHARHYYTKESKSGRTLGAVPAPVQGLECELQLEVRTRYVASNSLEKKKGSRGIAPSERWSPWMPLAVGLCNFHSVISVMFEGRVNTKSLSF